MTAITHSNREPGPDAIVLMKHLLFDENQRVGIGATSGHGPVALAALALASCAVLSNPIVGEVATSKPMFIIRSGKDETPDLSAGLGRFVAQAISRNDPNTLVVAVIPRRRTRSTCFTPARKPAESFSRDWISCGRI
ncbi:MAG: hypothetical protein H0W53_15970 [Acidobacteria bacterium]|nr:hypothetical protein [Acidobacteriota bacterium]